MTEYPVKRKPHRHSLSISKACYLRLEAYCETARIPIAGLVDQLLRPVIFEGQAISAPAVEPAAADPLPTPPPFGDERRGFPHPPPPPPPPPRPGDPIPVRGRWCIALSDSQIDGDIDAVIQRAAARGETLTRDDVLEAAVNRMLDELERTPWCRACLEAIEHCDCRPSVARSARR